MKILFIGSVQFSYAMLEHLLTVEDAEVIGVITKKQSAFNDDFVSLAPLAKEANIPCLFHELNNEEQMIAWVKKLQPEVIYCFGWSHLLKKELLELPKIGVIGYHPAALPKNRGRHPLTWALVLGLSQTASTFFFMDEGADSGDILNQVSMTIREDDNALMLYQKVTKLAKQQMIDFTRELANNTYERIPQNHNEASYWRKRTKEDGCIDWRMSSHGIHNLIRGLSKPYVGAHFMYEGSEIKVWKSRVVDHLFRKQNVEHIEHGKVLKNEEGRLIVKCGAGVVEISDLELEELPAEGVYL